MVNSICRPSILSFDTCMYLGSVASTQFLYVTTMEPLLGSIDFWTSHEFTCGSIQCERLVHYEMLSWPILWFISCYGVGVKVSTKTSVQLELTEAHPIWRTLFYFSHFSLIQAHNCAPFFFFWVPYSSRNILSNFENFSQPA